MVGTRAGVRVLGLGYARGRTIDQQLCAAMLRSRARPNNIVGHIGPVLLGAQT